MALAFERRQHDIGRRAFIGFRVISDGVADDSGVSIVDFPREPRRAHSQDEPMALHWVQRYFDARNANVPQKRQSILADLG